ncbi:transmembrane emp24 domain-containing protein 5 [Lepeophtheirus salmonis]|uniref:transmembrane emp24 domain-containing protein 5 n=1 Tax=Lepeophtheirus salmonis TaxID=72036 RepID=UPI001AE5A520|nr:transmembrane emp24 domain-containing protein 1-like [Lepeophtheirus salmonis]
MRNCLLYIVSSVLIGLFAGNEVSSFSMKTHAAQFTTLVPHQGKECFITDDLKTGQLLVISYVPISKESDAIEDSDISIELYDPHGGFVPKDRKDDEREDTSAYHDEHDYIFRVKKDGGYKICLINVNRWHHLYVYFEMYVKKPLPKEANEDNDFDDYDAISDTLRKEMTDYDIQHEDEYQMKVSDIRYSMMNILSSVESISFYQGITQAHYSRDHNIAINLELKVSFYSMLVIVALFGVGFIQIFMLKSLFNENTFFHRFIK